MIKVQYQSLRKGSDLHSLWIILSTFKDEFTVYWYEKDNQYLFHLINGENETVYTWLFDKNEKIIESY